MRDRPEKRDDPNLAVQALMLSISSASLYPLPLQFALPIIAEAGFDGIELVVTPGIKRLKPQEITTMVHDHGLRILSIHQALLDLPPWLSLSRRMTDAVELALASDCPRVVWHGPFLPDWNHPDARRWLKVVERLKDRTAGQEIILSIENPDLDPAVDDPIILGELDELVRFATSQDLSITLDTCHTARSGIDLLEAYYAVRERVINIHFSDWQDISPHQKSAIRRKLTANHRLPGRGQAPLERLIAQLARDGYGGPVTLEITPLALKSWSPAGRRRHLKEAVDYVRVSTQMIIVPGRMVHSKDNHTGARVSSLTATLEIRSSICA